MTNYLLSFLIFLWHLFFFIIIIMVDRHCVCQQTVRNPHTESNQMFHGRCDQLPDKFSQRYFHNISAELKCTFNNSCSKNCAPAVWPQKGKLFFIWKPFLAIQRTLQWWSIKYSVQLWWTSVPYRLETGPQISQEEEVIMKTKWITCRVLPGPPLCTVSRCITVHGQCNERLHCEQHFRCVLFQFDFHIKGTLIWQHCWLFF